MLGRSIQFIVSAVLVVMLGVILFAAGPATQLLQSFAQLGQAPPDDSGANGRASLQAQLDKNEGSPLRLLPVAAQNAPIGKAPVDAKDVGIENPLVDSLRKLVGDIPDNELDGSDRKDLVNTLDTADDVLRDQKRKNMQAILEANRQIRLKKCEKMNVLVIILDDVGFGQLGCYGQQLVATPYIDDLATRSIRFTQFYAGSSQDTAGRGTYLSGRHTGRGEMRDGDWITVRNSDFTMHEVMYQGGFDTGYFGKWAVGDLRFVGSPNEQGVRHFFGYLNEDHAENVFPDFLWRNQTKIALNGNNGGKKQQYANELIANEAIEFLRLHSEFRNMPREQANRIAQMRGRDRDMHQGSVTEIPFFLTVAFSMPVTASGADVPSDEPYSSTNWPQAKRNYASMITHVDRYVGDILRYMRDYDLDDHTIVVLTSDAGPRTNDVIDTEFFDTTGDLRGRQAELFEGAIRVPLLIYAPVGIKSGSNQAGLAQVQSQTQRFADVVFGGTHFRKRSFGFSTPFRSVNSRPSPSTSQAAGAPPGSWDSHKIWAMWDLPATLAEMTGCLRKPTEVDGRSRIDAMSDWQYQLAELSKPSGGEEILYWEVRDADVAQAVRMGDWKAVRVGARGEWQLYNLKDDLVESKNLAKDNPDLVKKIDDYVLRAQAPRALARRTGEEE